MRLQAAWNANITCLFLLAASPSSAAEPTPGECLAANESSIALRAQRQLRAARAQALVCASSSCPEVVKIECARRVERIDAASPTVVFELVDGSGAPLPSVAISMDGQALPEAVAEAPLSLDPGEHRFSFTAPGLPPVERTLTLGEAEKGRRERVVLARTAKPESSPPIPREPRPAARGGNAQRIVGAAAAGVGLAGVVLGSVFGLSAKSRNDESRATCGQPGPNDCLQAGFDLRNSARTDGTISTLAFVIGGVGLAAGAALWFTAPRATSVGLGPAAVQLKGVW